MVINSIRLFSRSQDGIKFYIPMSDWPLEQIPLPPNTTLWLFGDGPSEPYWRFFLMPDITVEKIVGIFNMPLPTEELFAWYQAEMSQRGWTQHHHNVNLPTKAYLHYHHPSENIKLVLSVGQRANPIRSWVVVTYVTIHPWPEVEANENTTMD